MGTDLTCGCTGVQRDNTGLGLGWLTKTAGTWVWLPARPGHGGPCRDSNLRQLTQRTQLLARSSRSRADSLRVFSTAVTPRAGSILKIVSNPSSICRSCFTLGSVEGQGTGCEWKHPGELRGTELCPAASAVHGRLAMSNTEHVILAPGETPLTSPWKPIRLGIKLTGHGSDRDWSGQLGAPAAVQGKVPAFLNMDVLLLTQVEPGLCHGCKVIWGSDSSLT